MTENKSIDYSMSQKDASELLGASVLPHEFRAIILQKYLEKNGATALVNIFSQFIGMSNSVVENCHESLALFGLCELKWEPYEAERANFPTIFGALNGVKLVQGVNQEKTCDGCACRLGSLANQSPVTTCDVDWCLQGDDKFWCHEELDEKGNPTKRCVGFQTHLKQRAA